jgi:hypothetical protein
MLASRFCLTGMTASRLLVGKTAKIPTPSFGRLMSQEVRQGHAARRRTLKEIAMSPTKGTPFNIGQGAVAGASALGLGALAFYGLGFSDEVGAADKAVMWPNHVRERVRDTYMYFGASIGVTAATAAAIFRSPAMMNIVMKQGWVAIGVSIAAMIGSGMLARSIPYEQGFGVKQLAWLGHCAVVGAVIAPVCLLGGAIVTR